MNSMYLPRKTIYDFYAIPVGQEIIHGREHDKNPKSVSPLTNKLNKWRLHVFIHKLSVISYQEKHYELKISKKWQIKQQKNSKWKRNVLEGFMTTFLKHTIVD